MPDEPEPADETRRPSILKRYFDVRISFKTGSMSASCWSGVVLVVIVIVIVPSVVLSLFWSGRRAPCFEKAAQ